jgi:hypothetical protein
MSKVEVTTIRIKIDNKSIELTMEQAKKLKDALNEMFVTHVHYEYVNRPFWYWGPYVPSSFVGTSLGTGTIVNPNIPYVLTSSNTVELNVC